MEIEFFDISFWQNLVSNSWATIIGLIFGIPIALCLDRRARTNQEKAKLEEEKGKKLQKKKDLLIIIRDALKKNYDLLLEIQSDLSLENLTFHNVDSLLLESVGSIKYEIIDDLEFNKFIDEIRYDIQHIHKRIDLQLEITFSSYSATTSYTKNRNMLISSTYNQTPVILTKIKKALKLIDEKLR